MPLTINKVLEEFIMETMAINFDDLVVGSSVKSIKTGEVFEVTEIADKITIFCSGAGYKVLSQSTLKRWYKYVIPTEEEAVAEQVMPEAYEPIPEPISSNPCEEIPEVIAPELEEIEPPVQPAIQARNTLRQAPNQQEEDPVLVALRQKIIDDVIAQCPNAEIKKTGSYTALRVGKYNFAEVYKGKRRFNIRLIGNGLSAEQASNCTIAPKSYGWTLDATFTVLVESDYDMAMELLKASYVYRFNNTPKRGFTKNK